MTMSLEQPRRLGSRLAAIVSSIGLVALSTAVWFGDWRDAMLPWLGLTLMLSGLLLFAQQDRRAAWLHRSLQRSLLTRGAGIYGVLTLARFLQFELHDLIDGLREFVVDEALLWTLLRDWLIRFSLQSLQNSIEAVMWPVHLLREFGWVALAVVFAAFGPLSRLVNRLTARPDDDAALSAGRSDSL